LQHSHWRLVASSAAMLAVTVALTVSGCMRGAVNTSVPSASAGSAPAVTEAQARQAFDRYVAASSQASWPDRASASSILTGVERAVVGASRGSRASIASIAARAGSDPSGSSAYSSSLTIDLAGVKYAYGSPAFFIPEQAGYPKFFAAYTTRTVKGTFPAGSMSVWVGGVKVPADGPVLMLFSQESAGAPWKLGSTSRLPAGVRMPVLATDARGAVPQVALSAPGLLVSPRDAGALQAAVVDDGPASAASRVVAAGPLTTGLYAGARSDMGLAVPLGDVYQWTLEGSTFPAFALRTADGGALVFYSMTLNTTVAVPDVINKADPIRPGRPIQVPLTLLPLLPPGTSPPREELQSQETLSFAAVDPPAGGAKLAVVAIGGGLTSASSS
jgi:hypothetical protein